MDDLVTFLRARYEERRAAAQAAYDEASDYRVLGSDLAEEHFAYWRPADVLADIDAKLRIVDELEHADPHDVDYWGGRGGYDRARAVLHFLAAAFSEHEDFNEGWRTP